MEGNYCKQRVLEALHIHQQRHTSNLDCGMAINPSWLPLLNKPVCSWHISKLIYHFIFLFNFIHNFPSSPFNLILVTFNFYFIIENFISTFSDHLHDSTWYNILLFKIRALLNFVNSWGRLTDRNVLNLMNWLLCSTLNNLVSKVGMVIVSMHCTW